MTAAETTARAIIHKRTTAALVADFMETTHNNDRRIPTVRGWIMDELESRDPAAFEAWLDGPAHDEDLPRFFC